MACRNKDIQELLPVYLAGELGGNDLLLVQSHLRSCTACARETELLRRIITGDPVPDPGDAFWTGMPERVYRAVQQEHKGRAGTRSWQDIFRGAFIPRWAWTAAALCIVLIISWLIVNPVSHRGSSSYSDEYAYDDVSSHDPVLRHTSTTIAELSSSELDVVDAWTSTELSSLVNDAGDAVESALDSDVSEELAELADPEVDRLSTMLNELNEEG